MLYIHKVQSPAGLLTLASHGESISGSRFRQMVWSLLLEIPKGHTTTYGAIGRELAVRTGRVPMSAQAIGGAVGHNPISILIPCHRVLGADGGLRGYAGGIEVKKMLLALEAL